MSLDYNIITTGRKGKESSKYEYEEKGKKQQICIKDIYRAIPRSRVGGVYMK